MYIVDIILKKRNGGELSTEEIQFFVEGYVSGKIPDYQAAALMMAVWFRGMNTRETTDLTLAMMRSGDMVDLSSIEGIKVDKHSTGGVADTTTLILAPLVAACGGRVAKMSGRGLGHTGGTLDKLESIPGFSVDQSMERFRDIVNETGVAVIGQTANLVPADKMLYSLRDVTGTVDNLSLIAGSIMSKKLASGSDAIVLDVKTGTGAFMRETDGAKALARVMVDIGNNAGKKTVALVTDMNQPLGNAVGNALEVREAVEILKGQHPGDLKDVALALGVRMLILAGIAADEEQALRKLKDALNSGQGLARFRAMVEAQGGNPAVADDPEGILPAAKRIVPVKAEAEGYISGVENSDIGISALLLGAGRQKKTDVIDPAVGIWMNKRLGDGVRKGDVLAEFHVNDEKNLRDAIQRFTDAITITEEKPQKPPLIYAAVE